MSSGFDSGASPKPYASHADEQTMTCNSGRADERTRIADLLITRKNRRVSRGCRLFQNPLGKPNTRTSNILEQPEMRPGWCTIGVRGRTLGGRAQLLWAQAMRSVHS